MHTPPALTDHHQQLHDMSYDMRVLHLALLFLSLFVATTWMRTPLTLETVLCCAAAMRVNGLVDTDHSCSRTDRLSRRR